MKNLADRLQGLAARLRERARRRRASAPLQRSGAEPVTYVRQLMTGNPRTCGPADTLHDVARIMWDTDCGCVPVVDADGRAVAMITDRDICMAAYTQGKPLGAILVSSASSRSLVAAREGDTLQTALDSMRDARVRRLPVIDAAGRLVGVLSWSDLVRHEHLGAPSSGGEADRLASTFAAICEREPKRAALR